MSARWHCAQIGAREHYAIPRVLAREGRLGGLYTEAWRGSRLPLKSLSGRWHDDLASATVRHWTAGFVAHQALGRVRRSSEPGAAYLDFIRTGEWFGRRVRQALARQRAAGEPIFFGFDTGFLEPAQWARAQGWRTVVDQIDPGETEFHIVQEEEQRWLDWVSAPLVVPDAYNARRQTEWAAADRIVVNSEWSREALIEQGVSPQKLCVIPLAYEAARPATEPPAPRTFSRERPLRVLFLGQVLLRKGIQYLAEAARLLADAPVRFDVVGPLAVREEALRAAPESLIVHGRCPREQVGRFYAEADVFILPTLSDGFAITQIEAMTHGLPVIATPACGRVVSEANDGHILPTRDPEAIADCLRHYLAKPDHLRAQSAAALKKSRQFSLDHLRQNLLNLESDLLTSC